MTKQIPSGLPEPDPGYEWRVDLSDHIKPCPNRKPHGRHEWLDGVKRENCPGVLLTGKHPRKPGEATGALHD